MKTEKVLRVHEFAERTGYKQTTIRKKIAEGEIRYFKPDRLILIPESEVARLLGPLRYGANAEELQRI